MGGGDVSQPPDNNTVCLASVFEEQFPVYMSMGMSYEEFFYGTPSLAKYYRQKYIIERDRKNYDLWLGGYYQYVAIATALGNAFKSKGERATEYLKEPIPIRPKTEKELKEEQNRKNEAMVKKLNMLQSSWLDKHKDDKDGRGNSTESKV